MLRVFLLLIGFGVAVAGGISLIAFLNLLEIKPGAGYYFTFISHRFETYMFLGGLFLMWASIYFPSTK